MRTTGITDDSIAILRKNGVVDTKVLLALEKHDIIGLGLNLGQWIMLLKLVEELRASTGEETKYTPKTIDMTIDEKLDNMNEDNFWCLFRCQDSVAIVGMSLLFGVFFFFPIRPMSSCGATLSL